MKLKLFCVNTESFMSFDELQAFGEANNLKPEYYWDNGYSSCGCDVGSFDMLKKQLDKWEAAEYIPAGRFADNRFLVNPEKGVVNVKLVNPCNYQRYSEVSFS